ncbi:hypothetical protein OH77DRAFT_1383018, partial [Trametes cingulata]
FCQSCKTDFGTPAKLIEHYALSSRHPYCRRCNLHFPRWATLSEHTESVHQRPEALLDTTPIPTASQLPHHPVPHPTANRHCAPCNRTFTSPGNLDSHRRSHRHQPKAVACPASAACGMHFVSLAALFLHLEHGTCPSGVGLPAVVRIAIRLDRGALITEPGARVQSTSSILRELAIQLALREGLPYKCAYCPRTFRAASALRQHLRSAAAHAEPVFRCPGCGARFRTLGALCQHVE